MIRPCQLDHRPAIGWDSWETPKTSIDISFHHSEQSSDSPFGVCQVETHFWCHREKIICLLNFTCRVDYLWSIHLKVVNGYMEYVAINRHLYQSLNIILADSHSTQEPIAMEDFFYGFCRLGLNPQVELFIFNWNERLDFSHQETERE